MFFGKEDNKIDEIDDDDSIETNLSMIPHNVFSNNKVVGEIPTTPDDLETDEASPITSSTTASDNIESLDVTEELKDVTEVVNNTIATSEPVSNINNSPTDKLQSIYDNTSTNPMTSPQATTPQVTTPTTNPVTIPPKTEPEVLTKEQKKLLKERDEELKDIIYSIENPNAAPRPRTEEEPVRRKHRTVRTKRKVVSNRKLSNFSLFLIISGIITLLLTAILILINSANTKDGAEVKLGDKIVVKNSINNYVLRVIEVSNQVEVAKSGTSSYMTYPSNTFVRIKISLRNNKKVTTAVRGANRFSIYSQNHQFVADCYTANDLMDYAVTGAFPSSIPAKTQVEGYLYCPAAINYFPVLEITAIKELDEDAAARGEIVGKSANTYYVDTSA